MADLPTLRATLARLEAATWPDRELDAAIDAAINGWASPRTGVHTDTGESFVLPTVSRFTASIDAAVALVERVLPGRVSDILRCGLAHAFARLGPDRPLSEVLPRTIVASLFRALIAKEQPR